MSEIEQRAEGTSPWSSSTTRGAPTFLAASKAVLRRTRSARSSSSTMRPAMAVPSGPRPRVGRSGSCTAGGASGPRLRGTSASRRSPQLGSCSSTTTSICRTTPWPVCSRLGGARGGPRPAAQRLRRGRGPGPLRRGAAAPPGSCSRCATGTAASTTRSRPTTVRSPGSMVPSASASSRARTPAGPWRVRRALLHPVRGPRSLLPGPGGGLAHPQRSRRRRAARRGHGRRELPRGPALPARRVFLHARNRWWFLAKNLRLRTLLLTAPSQLAYEAAYFSPRPAASSLGSWLRGKLAALAGLPGLLGDRLRVQRGRVLEDQRLLVGGPMTLTPDAGAKALLEHASWIAWHAPGSGRCVPAPLTGPRIKEELGRRSVAWGLGRMRCVPQVGAVAVGVRT